MNNHTQSFHKANKHPLGGLLVGRLLMEWPLRRTFRGFYASVHPVAMRNCRRSAAPLIICLTHSGWWDGHLAYALGRRVFKRDDYLMMEEKQLSRYSFFTWVGAFGIVRENPRSALGSLVYSASLLERPHSLLWIFPQGEMAHQDARPLRIFGGAANVARRLERCAIVPMALRYDFLREQAPTAFARAGAPIEISSAAFPGSKELTERLQEAMTATADALRDDVYAHNLAPYRLVLGGRGSVSANWDRVRALAGLSSIDAH